MGGKWTVGPWRISPFEVNNGAPNRVVMGADGYGVAWLNGRSEAEHDADAHLIAAAPALYEALQLILPLAKGYASANRVGSNAEYIAEAEQALSQAIGEGQ